MQKILRGARAFSSLVHKRQERLYLKLAKGQRPDALFLTCADSRIVPSTLTQTGPGELFIIRNAGNLVPCHGMGSSGEAASLEFAVLGLKIPDIIVCGHTDCGAIKYLLQSRSPEFPLLSDWVKNAEQILTGVTDETEQEERLETAYRQNVLLQMRNLLSYPFVADAVQAGDLRLHGWLYDIRTGEILVADPVDENFRPIE
ncbi:carbonic anhydrase [bacterium]|nr:carbonic anhydrase [bacterium]